MKTIYVVWHADDYESSENIRAYESREDADKLVEQLREYQLTKPQFNAYEDDDDRFDSWLERVRDWEKKHPVLEGFRGADNFGVDEIVLWESQEK